MRIVIIGAGLGGLSAAALLAGRGHQVTVIEKNSTAGGKMSRRQTNGYYFDTGPSLLTMPFVLEALFERCDASLQDHLSLDPLNPLCRYFYPDGTVFNSYRDQQAALEEIRSVAPADAAPYRSFMEYAAGLYHKTADAFLFNPLHGLQDLRGLKWKNLTGIDAFSSVSRRVDQYFESPYLRQFFKRFTTYNGSSPYQAPATLNVIPHVEINQGGYYVRGGMYRIAEAIQSLAEKQGATFSFNTEITRIDTEDRGVRGVRTHFGEHIPADLVVANSDVQVTLETLLGTHALHPFRFFRRKASEPSSSGFVLLLGVERKYPGLAHHNIFFSGDYRQEFARIFEDGHFPDDPTIYVANTSESDPSHAPAGCSNLFVLVNAPYLNGKIDWEQQKKRCRDLIIRKLERQGLQHLEKHIAFEEIMTPLHFRERYHAYRGSIYGTSSNSRLAAFVRPGNKSRAIDGLYFVGGSAHPGGGIPLVLLSSFHADELISRYEEE